MKPRSIASLAAAAILSFGACVGGGLGSPAPTGSGQPGLDGRAFLSTALEGRALVAGSRVRLSFSGGRISGGAGCNILGGPYVVEDGILIARDLWMTEMACQEPLMAQDAWLAGLLDGATLALAGDTLTLAKDGVRLTLVDREVADPDRPLLGTRWILDGLVSGDAVSSVPNGVVAALTFSPGRVDVQAGCNSGGGPVGVTEATLTVGQVSLTKMLCGGAAMALERAVIDVLAGQIAYTIEADTLTLRSGSSGLVFQAAR